MTFPFYALAYFAVFEVKTRARILIKKNSKKRCKPAKADPFRKWCLGDDWAWKSEIKCTGAQCILLDVRSCVRGMGVVMRRGKDTQELSH